MEFLKLQENFRKFAERVEKAGGLQGLYNTRKSMPFATAIHLNEADKMMRKIDDALSGYARRDMYVAKELNQMKDRILTIRENLKSQ